MNKSADKKSVDVSTQNALRLQQFVSPGKTIQKGKKEKHVFCSMTRILIF